MRPVGSAAAGQHTCRAALVPVRVKVKDFEANQIATAATQKPQAAAQEPRAAASPSTCPCRCAAALCGGSNSIPETEDDNRLSLNQALRRKSVSRILLGEGPDDELSSPSLDPSAEPAVSGKGLDSMARQHNEPATDLDRGSSSSSGGDGSSRGERGALSDEAVGESLASRCDRHLRSVQPRQVSTCRRPPSATAVQRQSSRELPRHGVISPPDDGIVERSRSQRRRRPSHLLDDSLQSIDAEPPPSARSVRLDSARSFRTPSLGEEPTLHSGSTEQPPPSSRHLGRHPPSSRLSEEPAPLNA